MRAIVVCTCIIWNFRQHQPIQQQHRTNNDTTSWWMVAANLNFPFLRWRSFGSLKWSSQSSCLSPCVDSGCTNINVLKLRWGSLLTLCLDCCCYRPMAWCWVQVILERVMFSAELPKKWRRRKMHQRRNSTRHPATKQCFQEAWLAGCTSWGITRAVITITIGVSTHNLENKERKDYENINLN